MDKEREKREREREILSHGNAKIEGLYKYCEWTVNDFKEKGLH